MNLIFWALAGMLLLGYFVVLIWCIAGILRPERSEVRQWKQWPKVSVLLAARNEEKLILRNLKALASLNYPQDCLEILIGDDQSEDRTAEIVKQFIAQHPNMKLLEIKKNMGMARGKANVLAHLAHHAHGDFYFITDVDVQVPPDWIKDLLERFTPETGLVSGTTLCDHGNLFAEMQRIDWMHFMGYIKAMANVGIACTSVGNNMAVRADAYWETGGYENIRFSITEDYRLFQEVTRRGWQWANILTPGSTGQAWYIDRLSDFLNQRKRWLQGAVDLPLNWKLMLFVFGAFIPLFWGLVWFYPAFFSVLLFTKCLLQSWFIMTCFKKAELRPPGVFYLVLYEVYLHWMVLASAVFFALPLATSWKGRKYNKAYLNDI